MGSFADFINSVNVTTEIKEAESPWIVRGLWQVRFGGRRPALADTKTPRVPQHHCKQHSRAEQHQANLQINEMLKTPKRPH